MLIVFFISGLWHGAYWHFIAWGVLNGIFAVIGQILKPLKSSFYKRLKIDEKVESIVLLKRIVVFYLITLTWVFFTSGIMDSLRICKRIILFDFLSIFDPGLLNIAGTVVSTFITVLATVFFCTVQVRRQDERLMYEIYDRQPFFLQCLPIAIMICICIFGASATDASVDTQFLYFQF